MNKTFVVVNDRLFILRLYCSSSCVARMSVMCLSKSQQHHIGFNVFLKNIFELKIMWPKYLPQNKPKL